jgi:hypothetical protein
MNKYYALVKKIGDIIEEEVTLGINGFEVTCFVGVCPYEIHEGEKYPVSFELMIIDDYCVEESIDQVAKLERIGNGFSYWVSGKLKDGIVDSLIPFEDEVLLSEFSYLDGKYIRIKADRIDVEFLT